MKHFLARAALVGALIAVGLAGSACTPKTIGDAIVATVSGVENPAGDNTLAGIKSAYAIAAAGAKAYASLPLCKKGASGIDKVCRSVRTQEIKKYDRQAYTAVKQAEQFVKDNPRVTPYGAYAAANAAIAALKAAAPDPRK